MKRLLTLLRRLAIGATLAGVVCLLVAAAGRSPLAGDAERSGYDLLVNARGYPAQNPHIVLVDFDDATVAGYKSYPVPRGAVAAVIDRVAGGDAELIGLDVMLSEARSPEDDRAMAEALKSAGNVIVAGQMGSEQIPPLNPREEFCAPDPKSPSNCAQGAAFGVGFVNFAVDDDGFVRRAFLLPTRDYPVLPFAAALATNFRGQPLRQEAPGRYRLGATPVRLDDSGLNTFLIGSWGVPPAPAISAQRVLEGSFPPDLFRGKIVLIGESSAAGKDRHFTPVFRPRRPDGSRVMLSGAEIHAAALATLLDGTAVRVTSPRVEWMLYFLLAWLAVLLILEERPLVSVLAVVA
ncbi:MAG TPA: CHASE2 domain-containing protein, partial [Terriglobales bacterium]|nr:CHASE2 domain-containing protein [Terriglobales bacterium]